MPDTFALPEGLLALLLHPAFIMLAKCIFIAVILIHVAPIMVWVERRGSALMQNRLGPNRVGPLGLLQSLADAIKFIFKEDAPPGHVKAFYWWIAPVVSVIPAFMTFAVVPFASQIQIGETLIKFQLANLDVGMLFIFAIGSLGVYGIIVGGWASNSKFALFGSLRSTAQMISYELSLGLSVVGAIMMYSTVNLNEIVLAQNDFLKWGVFLQPIGFLLFLTCSYAETNRLPFDLPEGESEIVAGYHLEYGAMKFAVFMMAEYVNMTTMAALAVTLYFGGWQPIPAFPLVLAGAGTLAAIVLKDWTLKALFGGGHFALAAAVAFAQSGQLTGLAGEWARVAIEMASFFFKLGFFLWLFVWVRWTLPRFRYDQLMNLGWKVMLPLSLINIFVTGLLIYGGIL